MKPIWKWIHGPLGQVLVTILSLLVLFVLARYYRSHETSPNTDRIERRGERGTGRLHKGKRERRPPQCCARTTCPRQEIVLRRGQYNS